MCGHCQRLGSSCSLSKPSPTDRTPALDEGHTLNIDDLRLLHHWHNASREENFAPFVDHAHVDSDREYDDLITKSFRHPYLLHCLLSLSALHMLHGSGVTDGHLYQLAAAHNFSGTKLVRPQVARGDPEHRDAVFNFAAFASLFAMAEPPLRPGDAAITTPADAIGALLDAFKMGKGVRAVMDPFLEELKASGAWKPELWRIDEDDISANVEAEYPQLASLKALILEHCEDSARQPCTDAVQSLFINIGVFARNHKNHSSLRLVMTWPTDLDPVCLTMFETHDRIGLVILAHYAALMSMRINYWFFSRWPKLLLDAATSLLSKEWQGYLVWPRRVISENMDGSLSTSSSETLSPNSARADELQRLGDHAA